MASSIVSEIRNLDGEFRSCVQDFKEQLRELDQHIDAAAPPKRGDEYHRQVLEVFEHSQRFCRQYELQYAGDVNEVRRAQEYFRSEISPWFCKSWIANRAHSKPSGFAGDYEMLIKLYDEATPASGLGGYIDLCILDLPLARAVRGRLSAARQFLLGEIESRNCPTRILDIASGPCREYLDWPTLDHPLEVVALDNDKMALDYVGQNVVPGMPIGCQLRPVRYNALRTRSAEATIRNFGSFDIIYSVGLCDYLTDDHLVGLFSGWRATLNENGALYIAFKDTEQYDKTPYQWHLDWFFYQRTESDVKRLYERAGFDLGELRTTRDSTNIIINFLTRRAASTIVRYDSATESTEVRAPKLHSEIAVHLLKTDTFSEN